MTRRDLELNNQSQQRPVKRLMTPLLTKSVPPIPKQSERKPLPILQTNYISRLFFTWLIPMLNTGYKRTLQQEDLWYLHGDLELDTIYKTFQNQVHRIILTKRQKTNDDSGEYPKYTLAFALLRTVKWEITFSILLNLLSKAAVSFTPLVTKYLIKFVQKKSQFPETPVKEGIAYALGVALLVFIQAVFLNQSLLLSKLVGGQSRTILTKALLEKSLVASPEIRHKFPNGKIISMMGADLSRIDLAFAYLPGVFAFPVPVVIGIIILLLNIGVSSLAGISIFLVIFIGILIPSALLMQYRKSANEFTDKRVSLTREILVAMKMIKLYSWEDAYEHMVNVTRKKEVSFVFKIQFIFAMLYTIAMAAPAVTSTTAFLVLYALDKTHDPAAVFSSLTLFNMLSTQVADFPFTLSHIIDALTALTRISEYLQSPNLKSAASSYDHGLIKDGKTAVKVLNGSFEWDVFEEVTPDHTEQLDEKSLKKSKVHSSAEPQIKHSTVKILENISFEIQKGEFVVITGTIGSGKSSLLSAISGLMAKSQGAIDISGSFILCGAPWVQNATVKENILFGSLYDPQLYHDTIEACSLASDIESFRAGDRTEIGERGVTLSGGQKARLTLARAVYANKDIYLLDDILSAVDANVGKQITENCLLGLISKKTRILATHQLSLISKADRIIFLSSDGGIDIGTEAELSRRNEEFVELMNHNQIQEDAKRKEDEKSIQEEAIRLQFDRSRSGSDAEDNLMGVEERAVNSISFSVYKQYFVAGQGVFGFLSFPLLVISITLGVFVTLFTNVWLSFWIENKFKNLTTGTYIGLYIMFTFTRLIFNFLEFGLFGYISTKASEVLNLKAIAKILHTPMSYMDTTPLGRIINRFSKDTNSLDNEIGIQLKVFFHYVGYCVGILILAIIYIPWMAIGVPFLLMIVLCITNYYQASAREVKRLEAINRSFILNNFNEVLGGLTTIKAYNAESRFLKRNSKFSDMMNEVYFVVIANQRWIGMNLDTVASVAVLLVALLTVTGQFQLSASSAGLLVSSMIEFSMILSDLLKYYAEVENEMNSVERLCHYAFGLEQEAPYMVSETTPPPDWPSQGAISFKNIDLRYREGLPLILKNLSFEVEAGSKVGICGRTGAGKSSLMTALYRIVELSSGSIEIDGIDISRLGLHQLRKNLSIIPQDPVLFQGTLRRNLDPFNERSDEVLWDALRRSGLLTEHMLEEVRVQTTDYHKFHLLSQVEDEGSNFSLGERQLIALARALVRNSKILIMDEATSSVDYETDALVQRTITNEFKHCTVLCIAHRLRTIINHDKILVLEQGELEEFGKPLDLFKQGGIFREMCEASDLTEESFM